MTDFLSRNGPTRRDFLRVSAGTAALVPITVLSEWTDDGHVPQEDWVRTARRQIPATSESSYFQTGGVGPSPKVVTDVMTERLVHQNRGPADPAFSAEMADIEPRLRAYLADTFGVERTGVALTHSTSEGISIAAWALNWKPGDEVVISNQEHPANVVPWYVLRDRFGIVIRGIDLGVGSDWESEVRAVLSPRTRMVSLSHISRNNGRRLRTEACAELGQLLRARGVLFHLDGAQGPGCVPVNFDALGCDCYSTCGHKWLMGPKGTGALFVREDQLENIQLSWAGSHSHVAMDYEGSYSLIPSAARYEFGTRALADFAGFQRAVEWMTELGWDRIHQRIQDLVGYAIKRTIDSTRLHVGSPKAEEDRSGVFVVHLPTGCDANKVYEQLGVGPRIVTSPVRQEGDLRLAIHFFNTKKEIDSALHAIDRVC
jgi:selenocysteine lyase/cysteine desulfurase